LIHEADHVVFISNYIADKVTSRIPVKNYSIIYNPLGEEYIAESPDKEITKNILFVGAVKEYKGIDVILNALPAVIKEHKDIKLTIAGEGDIEKYMNKAARLKVEKHVAFMGKVPVSRMIDLYDQSDVLIAPSIRPEPFGRTIIEGMARQCVPVASNHGGPVEIIKNGDTGFLFSTGDHKDLSQLILSLYEDEKKLRETQRKARTDSIERFNPSVIAKQYEKIFLEL
jgi:glycosyltransferase involved in cell wall biosynthesis